MPGKKQASHKPFISIIGGKLRQTVPEGTEGAVLRKYETKSGDKGEKFELVYDSWYGKIERLEFRDTDFGQVLNVHFSDVIIAINTDSRYFTDFAKKIVWASPEKRVTISPYDFVASQDNGQERRMVGVSISQDGVKLRNNYYSNESNAYIERYPLSDTPYGEMTKDDIKVYHIQVKKFLVQEVKDYNSSIQGMHTSEREVAPASRANVNSVAPIKVESNDKGGVNIDDVPF